jgi:hypothetical protein
LVLGDSAVGAFVVRLSLPVELASSLPHAAIVNTAVIPAAKNRARGDCDLIVRQP